jgi:hypothetical protein
MWQPNGAQWKVIWFAVVIGLLGAGLAYNNGINGYAIFGATLLLAALRVWQLEGRRQSSKPKRIFCGECGGELDSDWKHCPACGSKSWKARP